MSLKETESGTGLPSSEASADEILQLISSTRKIDRDLGAKKLRNFLVKLEDENFASEEENKGKYRIRNYVLTYLERVSSEAEKKPRSSTEVAESNWEAKHGCLLACYPLFDSILLQPAEKSEDDLQFVWGVQRVSLKLLKNDPTKNVQLAAGNVLGYASKILGDQVYQSSKETIFNLIAKNLRASDESASLEDQLISPEQGFDINLPASLIRDKVVKEFMGWNLLEPSLKCLQCMIENLNLDFCKYVDQQLIDLVWACLSHHNRYVRETGFQIIYSLIGSAPVLVKEFGQQLADYLRSGLSDNWNQVRLAASIATRKFLQTSDSKERFYPILLPSLCLNRYYKSEGVRIYSQESWRLIVGTEGRHLVAKYFTEVVNFYVGTATSTNPADREAACSSISELVQKVDRGVVTPRILQLLEMLDSCSKDESWSVRDASNLAFGNCTKFYPETAKPFLNNFYPILFKTLEDPIPLMRQGAASSLASIVLAFGSEAQALVIDKIINSLSNFEKMDELKTEIINSTSDSSSAPITRENTIVDEKHPSSIHTSSCELEESGKNRILPTTSVTTDSNSHRTCPGCLISKTSQPWHVVDGCLYLVGALAEITQSKSELSPLIPLIVRAANKRTYPDHYVVLETLCKIVPLLAKSIGKKPFKEFLSLLFEPIFCAIESSNPATSATGKQTIQFLAKFIGPNILKSRVEMYDARYLSLVQECHIDDQTAPASTRTST